MKVLFTKYNSYRNKQFNIATYICSESGKKYVVKKALNELAVPHIGRLYNGHKLILDNAVSKKVLIPEVLKLDDKTVRFDYVDGKTYESILIDAVKEGDLNKFKELILNYKKWLYSVFVTEPGNTFSLNTGEFVKKEISYNIKDEYYRFAPLDLIFSNLIVNKDGLNLIDQEWNYDFKVPVSYMLYRSISYIYGNNPSVFEDKIAIEDIFSLVGIPSEDLSVFGQIESVFQSVVRSNYFSEMSKYKKAAHKLDHQLFEEIKLLGEKAELYLTDRMANGNYEINGNRRRYVWKNVVLDGVVRLKVATPFLCYSLKKLSLTDQEGRSCPISSFRTNSIYHGDVFNINDVFIIDSEVPLIEFDIGKTRAKELVLDIEVLFQGKSNVENLLEARKIYGGFLRSKVFKIYRLIRKCYSGVRFLIKAKEIIKACSYVLRVNFVDRFKFKKTIKDLYNGLDRKYKKICLFASYDPDSCVKEYVKYYLNRLSELGYDLVFITSSESLKENDKKFLLERCFKVIHRTNVGYDFGSWATGYKLLRADIKESEHLLLVNDSVFGPVKDIRKMFDHMNVRDFDVWGCTDSFEHSYHLQSYFIGFNSRVLNSGFLDGFLGDYTAFAKKTDIINKYEIGLSKALIARGYKLGAYCSYRDIASYVYWDLPSHPYHQYSRIDVNQTHYFWDVLVNDFNCPFIKKELFIKNPMGIQTAGSVSNLSKGIDYNVSFISECFTK